jgi:hypothetical protein
MRPNSYCPTGYSFIACTSETMLLNTGTTIERKRVHYDTDNTISPFCSSVPEELSIESPSVPAMQNPI